MKEKKRQEKKELWASFKNVDQLKRENIELKQEVYDLKTEITELKKA